MSNFDLQVALVEKSGDQQSFEDLSSENCVQNFMVIPPILIEIFHSESKCWTNRLIDYIAYCDKKKHLKSAYYLLSLYNGKYEHIQRHTLPWCLHCFLKFILNKRSVLFGWFILAKRGKKDIKTLFLLVSSILEKNALGIYVYRYINFVLPFP